jgi:hypothetical protein
MPQLDDPPNQPWYQFLDIVDRLIEDDENLWAWPTLQGVRETVLATRRVTDSQVLTVQRISALADFGVE